MTRTGAFRLAHLALAATLAAVPAAAQPAVSMEGQAGWGGFADDGVIHHGTFGGAARLTLSPRVSIGPELIYFVGPGTDRDLTLTGNVWVDLVRHARVTPFVAAGGGWFRHSQQFISGTFASSEGAFTGGGGVRVDVGRGWYVAPEVRVGWELHVRTSVAVGRRLGL
jgi:hypothetical protein